MKSDSIFSLPLFDLHCNILFELIFRSTFNLICFSLELFCQILGGSSLWSLAQKLSLWLERRAICTILESKGSFCDKLLHLVGMAFLVIFRHFDIFLFLSI